MGNRKAQDKRLGGGVLTALILLGIAVVLFIIYLALGFPPLVLAIFAAYLVAAGGSVVYFAFFRGKDDEEEDGDGN